MGAYDDIINLPHHQSRSRKHMSNNDRAAQFLPFAALTGYDEAIKETGRSVDEKVLLSQEEREEIDKRLLILEERKKERIEIKVSFFKKDENKDGGEYRTIKGVYKSINQLEKTLLIEEEDPIDIGDIYSLDSEIFKLEF